MRSINKTAVVVALGSAQTLAWGSTYYLPAILAAPIARDLGLPTSWIFGCFSGALILSAVLGPSVGRRIDQYGGRGVLSSTSVVFAVGLFGLACAQGLTGVILAWALLGLGMGAGLYDSAFAALTSMYGRDARGPITGITIIAGLASTIGWPISAALDAEFGWRTACFVWAGAHLVIGLPLNLLLGGPGAHVVKAASGTLHDAPEHRRAMFLLAFVFAASWFVTGSMAAHLPRLLEAAGTSATAAIAASALVGPAQVAARLAEFGFLRRAHPLISARIAASTHPIGALVFILSGGGPIAAGAFALLHGAGNGLLTIAKGTLPLEIFGPIGYGLRSGLIGAPARATQAIAPFLFSMVLDAGGPRMALLLSSSMTLAALAGLLVLRTGPRGAPIQSTGPA
jgi:predicted MFS family arabinose efflux permease